MNITDTIIPGKSIGGICIGQHVQQVDSALAAKYSVIREPNAFIIDDGLITAYHCAEGIISSISCNSSFTGNYQNKLWPGMTVADVLRNTKEQVAWSGFVQVDKIGGIGLSLPENRDDFESLSDNFELTYVFDELWVYDF